MFGECITLPEVIRACSSSSCAASSSSPSSLSLSCRCLRQTRSRHPPPRLVGARRASVGQRLRTSSHVIRGSVFSFATLINRFTASFITLTATFFFVAFFNSAHADLTSVTFVATSATVFAHKSCSFALLRTYILFSSYTRRWPVLCPATAFQPRRCHTQHLLVP